MSPPSVEKIRVLLVEDHPIFREQLRILIARDGTMEVCGECDNIREAQAVMERTRPHIAVVDISLKGSSGLELLKDLQAQKSALPVLVLSMHDESLYAERVLRAGARGYITKHEVSSAVMAAIGTVLAGEVYLSPAMTGKMLKRMSGGAVPSPGDALRALTDRELEVLQLIGAGKTARQVAGELNVGPTTVDTYRARIKEKLNLGSGAELQAYAARWLAQQGH